MAVKSKYDHIWFRLVQLSTFRPGFMMFEVMHTIL